VAGFSLRALAGIAAGISVGAVITVGATLSAADDHMPAQTVPAQSGPHLVQYGGRLPPLPCNSKQSCKNRLPSWIPH
jgi:Protein of unknown function (DUF2613)